MRSSARIRTEPRHETALHDTVGAIALDLLEAGIAILSKTMKRRRNGAKLAVRVSSSIRSACEYGFSDRFGRVYGSRGS
jgi:hypothetical protein